ncbi:hypothetical protein ACA910_019566 [Epithemia clementina (nom. ined.)]
MSFPGEVVAMTGQTPSEGNTTIKRRELNLRVLLLACCACAFMVFQQDRLLSNVEKPPKLSTKDNGNNQPSGVAAQQPDQMSSPLAAVEGFPQIVNQALKQISMEQQQREASTANINKRRTFDVNTWKQKTTGGLNDADRVLLAKIYGQASSVFEYGLGESTLIANHVGVPRYAGVDSDPVYVSTARQQVNNTHFRFYFADVGVTAAWGYPKQPLLPKNVWNYQLAPLMSELEPFDVYMVDGRWRQACLLATFLHASYRGRQGAPTSRPAALQPRTKVLVHDCSRRQYHRADRLLNHYQAPGGQLCVFERKPETTDAQLVHLWMKFFRDAD